MEVKQLSRLAEILITAFEKKPAPNHERKLSVNQFVSKVASWYEKLRNAMEYQEEEVILRSAIERILKRRLLLGGNAKTTAEPLVRELIWARYLPDEGVPESIVGKVEKSIDLFLQLRLKILQKHKLSDHVINEWIYHLLSSDLEHIVKPNPEEEVMSNFMFQLLKDNVIISDDTEETKNAQVYIAVRKAFAKDDIAFLRYHMFLQIFGKLTHENSNKIAEGFPTGYKEIVSQMSYPRKEKIFSYVKKNASPFLILGDVFKKHKENIKAFIENEKEFEKAIYETCERKYQGIASKVRRAIVRSFFFILVTKLIFAFAVEGSSETLLYGRVLWGSIALNTGIPPLLMIVVGLFIRTPGVDNTKRIYAYIQTILQEETPRLGNPIVVKKQRDKSQPFLITVFSALWFLAFVLSFGVVIFVLTKLHFNAVSQLVFIFFLAIVSFLAYRISLTAHLYRLEEREGVFAPFVDFLFMPVIRVGRRLTWGISQINIILFIFDLFIETPFKVIFAFFEQWFYFLRSKREEME